MNRRLPALIALAFMASLGLSACEDGEEVEVEENGEVEADD